MHLKQNNNGTKMNKNIYKNSFRNSYYLNHSLINHYHALLIRCLDPILPNLSHCFCNNKLFNELFDRNMKYEIVEFDNSVPYIWFTKHLHFCADISVLINVELKAFWKDCQITNSSRQAKYQSFAVLRNFRLQASMQRVSCQLWSFVIDWIFANHFLASIRLDHR